jgi:hypothetical protein
VLPCDLSHCHHAALPWGMRKKMVQEDGHEEESLWLKPRNDAGVSAVFFSGAFAGRKTQPVSALQCELSDSSQAVRTPRDSACWM